jgi:hypothetical protein
MHVAAAELRPEPPVGELLDAAEDVGADDPDALVLVFGVEQAAHVHVEARQDLAAAIENRRLHAEIVEDPGEFDCDVAAARNDNALGQPLQMEGVVGGDAEFVAFER